MAPHCPYYSLAWRPLVSHYNVHIWRAPNALNIALLGSLYLAIIMDLNDGPQTPRNLALPRGVE
jgi:hypothetical protein